MRTQAETGISDPEYSAILTSFQNAPISRVVAERHNPYWESHSVKGDRPQTSMYDAIAGPSGMLFRAYVYDGTLHIERLLAETPSAGQTWTEIHTVTSVLNYTPSLAYSASDGLWCFYVSYDAPVTINVIHTTDYSIWTDETVLTPTTVHHFAASSPSRLHYVEMRSDGNAHLYTYDRSGTWSQTVESDIYWPHAMDGFDALQDGDTDLLVFSSRYPADMGVRVDGSEVEHVAYSNAGVGIFRYKDEVYSDLFTIEYVDAHDTFTFRRYPKISKVGEMYVVSVLGRDGKPGLAHQAYHYYTSKDGRNWSMSSLAPTSQDMSAIMIEAVGFLYFIGPRETLRSERVRYFGMTPADAVVFDITSYVASLSEGALTLSFSDITTYENSFLAEPGIYRVYTYAGYKIDTVDYEVLIRVDEVDEVIDSEAVSASRYKHELALKIRPLSMYLTDRVKMPYVSERGNQVLGHDDFLDLTGTGGAYGGLRHTAVLSGSWKTDQGDLLFTSTNAYGIAHNTFMVDTWNGALRANMQWNPYESPYTNWAGLIVRAFDRGNFLYIVYNEGTQKWEVYQMSGGEGILLHQTGTYSYTLRNIYVMVEVKFSKLSLYVSEDGTDYSLIFNLILPGAEGSEDASGYAIESIPLEKGSWGYTGFEGAAEPDAIYDTWPDWSLSLPDINWPSTDHWTIPELYIPEYENVKPDVPYYDPSSGWSGTPVGKTGIIGLRWYDTVLGDYYSSVVVGELGSGEYQASESGLGLGSGNLVSQILLDPFDPDTALIVTRDGIFMNDNWRTIGNSWSLIVDEADIEAAATNGTHTTGLIIAMDTSKVVQGTLWILWSAMSEAKPHSHTAGTASDASYAPCVLKIEDYGSTITHIATLHSGTSPYWPYQHGNYSPLWRGSEIRTATINADFQDDDAWFVSATCGWGTSLGGSYQCGFVNGTPWQRPMRFEPYNNGTYENAIGNMPYQKWDGSGINQTWGDQIIWGYDQYAQKIAKLSYDGISMGWNVTELSALAGTIRQPSNHHQIQSATLRAGHFFGAFYDVGDARFKLGIYDEQLGHTDFFAQAADPLFALNTLYGLSMSGAYGWVGGNPNNENIRLMAASPHGGAGAYDDNIPAFVYMKSGFVGSSPTPVTTEVEDWTGNMFSFRPTDDCILGITDMIYDAWEA